MQPVVSMARRSPLCLLLVICIFLRQASCQNVCDLFVQNNILTVDAQTVDDIDATDSSFQDVVECLSAGAIIRFATERFSVGETIRIDKDISITSTHRKRTSIACNEQPVFDIRGRATVDISGIRIRKCELQSADAPIIIGSGSTVNLRSIEFFRNTNDEGTSGIRALDESSITIENCEFLENQGASGTVVLENASSLTVSGSDFMGNTATNTENGGGVFSVQSEGVSTTVVVKNDSTFIRNEAVGGDGGVFYVSGDDGIAFTIEDTVFRKNMAGRRGGAVFISAGGDLIVRDAFFVENESNRIGGGAIFAKDAEGNETLDIKISSTTFAQNEAKGYLGSGGGIRLQGKNVDCAITDSVSFALNTADLDGGGMHISNQATADINGSSFVGNEAFNGGGAALFVLSLQQNRALTMDVVITDTAFLFNRALYSDRGGCIGVAGFGSNVTITDCILSDNDGGRGAGGAIYVFGGPVVKIKGSAFERNKAERGGALYAENDALYEIESSDFIENSAGEGGAMHVRGDVDITMDGCTFESNKAITEGGAIKVRNFISAGDELARFRMTNSIVVENGAGTNLFEDRLYGTETEGGAILAEGSGIELELENNTFKRNLASNGGALSIYAVADCNIDNGNKFVDNKATFGGAIFLVVDEQVDPIRRNEYRVAGTVFRNNNVEFEGGSIYVSSTRTESNSVSLNARSFLLLVEGSNFTNNTARHGGGALSMVGSAAKVHGCTFESNIAVANSTSQATPFLGYGGAINIQTGSSVECKGSEFLSNRADVGGAVLVRDGSFEGEAVNFTRNAVQPRGVGGAVAVEISRGKDIPVLNSANRIRNIVFQCQFCNFKKNNGSLAGGAMHVHDMDPGGTYGEDNELKIDGCTFDNQNTFRTPENELTCPTYFRFLRRVNARSVRFKNTTFTANRARAGGAIFTNNFTMISILPDLQNDANPDVDNSLGYALTKNESQLGNSSVFFEKNVAVNNGFGDDAASTPITAFLFNLDDEAHQRTEGFTNSSFLSGDRLRFNIEFRDGIEQNVTFADNLTAYISCDDRFTSKQSNCAQLEISGQETAQANEDGTMNFTAVRLRGLRDQTYTLRIDYRSTSEMQTLHVNPSFIKVTMRPCKIGEKTVSKEGERLECRECGQGEFQSFPKRDFCLPCVESENHTMCDGQTIVPHDGYWHASSFSFIAHKCIGHEACRSTRKGNQTRAEKLRANAVKEHKLGKAVQYSSDDSNLQCREGYQGVLCGRCVSDYGREGNICRKCASPALRAFLMAMIILWSFVFLSCFIRSVLQLATRIKFNKRFNDARKGKESSSGGDLNAQIEMMHVATTSTPEISDLSGGDIQNREVGEIHETPAPSTSAAVEPKRITMERVKNLRPSSLGQNQENAATSVPTRRIGRRGRLIKALHVLLDPNASMDDVEPLTLANPVSEILKVTAVAVSINVDWEQSLRRTLFAMGALGNLSSGTGYLSLDCYLSANGMPKSLRRLTIAILYPLLMLIVYVVLWGCYAFVRRRGKQYLSQRILLTFLAINYFFYIGMTKSLLRFFACTRVSDDREDSDWSRYVWEEDTEVECYEGKHALLVGLLVVPLLLAVSFGYPAGVFTILWRSKDRLNDEDFVQTYGFLYKAYDRHYWEVVIMVRKAAVATVAVFSYRLGSNLQGLLCVLVIGIALSVHLVLQPFTQDIPQLNHLETCSLSATVVVFVVGLMMNDNAVEPSGRVLLSALAVLFLCFTLVVLLTQLMFAAEEFIDMKLIELDAMEVQEVIDSRLSKKLEALIEHYWKIALEAAKTFKALTRKRFCCHRRSGNATRSPVHHSNV